MIFELGDLNLYLHTNCAFVKGIRMHLQPLEYKLLKTLAINCESFLGMSELMHISSIKKTGTLTITLCKLRRKLSEYSKSVRIENINRFGYKLVDSPICVIKKGNEGRNRKKAQITPKQFQFLKEDVNISLRLLAKKHNVDVGFIKQFCTVIEWKKIA